MDWLWFGMARLHARPPAPLAACQDRLAASPCRHAASSRGQAPSGGRAHRPAALFQVWSEVNQAVLDHENRESTPKLAKLLKLLLWAQNELDQKKVKYPKMTDLSKGVVEEPK